MKTIPISEQLYLLIQSLSKAEKRFIRLASHLQSGDKNYMALFDLIECDTPAGEIRSRYGREQEEKSFETASKHLYRFVLDCLVRLREKQDVQTAIFNRITKAGILFERELPDAAFDELEKARKLAATYENDPLLLLIRRTELKYLSSLGFEGISERELVGKQMKINDTMKYSRNTNQHLQLYDILKHRIAHKGYARSDKQKQDLNDLVLSELNLIANHSYRGFEARKLHLLFQADYYLNTGNFKSAIRFYQELIFLFDAHRHLLSNPPIYYLSAIQGILDSLQTVGLYQEMPFFISKLKEIAQSAYPAEFIREVRAKIYLYESAGLLNTGQFTAALRLYKSVEDVLYKKIDAMGLETQLRLYLNQAILFLCLGSTEKARKSMKKIFGSGKLYHTLPSYKTARLINLLVQAESGHYDFFGNEINAIKRNIRYEKQTYRTEKLLFRFVMAYPLPAYRKSAERLWQQLQKELSPIRQDKYEKRLLKTFDFLTWIESRLTGSDFGELLSRSNR